MKKRILLTQPYLRPSGGGNLVGAWTLQALRDLYDLSVATLEPIDWGALNRSFGTSLSERDFQVWVAPDWYQRVLQWMPTQGVLLRTCLAMRFAQDLDRRHHYDLLFSTQNEADFHRRGVQYVHFPSVHWPLRDNNGSHRVPGVLRMYSGACRRLARGSNEGLRGNVFLANSKFTAEKIRSVHGVDPVLLYPPVPGDFPETPWESRAPDFIASGRIAGCKRWEMGVSILEEVRRRGYEVNFTLVGQREPECLEYCERIEALAKSRPWFRIRYDISRRDLMTELGRHRYAIHTMEEEHFGISVAEAQRAGCISFVHNSGGPVEIVGAHSQLTFGTTAEAVEKICQVLSSTTVAQRLRRHVAEQRDLFTSERFCTSLRDIIAGMF